ncbi:unnamed protein product [Pleuronectes platessa]|uniref:Uncharacterized protein n=1 Tax=Pleuronectes platessa TaxID=8262 RepID=A0A9N7YLN0_PLEPL|nr:unnamed protein product [Pleuronectes platessa]
MKPSNDACILKALTVYLNKEPGNLIKEYPVFMRYKPTKDGDGGGDWHLVLQRSEMGAAVKRQSGCIPADPGTITLDNDSERKSQQVYEETGDGNGGQHNTEQPEAGQHDNILNSGVGLTALSEPSRRDTHQQKRIKRQAGGEVKRFSVHHRRKEQSSAWAAFFCPNSGENRA